ncbi:MAG: histidine kinase [Cyclobacteriaceae bacterium]
MQVNPKFEVNWKREIIGSIIILVCGGLFGVLLWCDTCWHNSRFFAINFTYNGFFWLLLWKGSEYLVWLLDGVYSWLEHPVKRVLVSILSIVVYTSIVVYFLDFLYDVFVFNKTVAEALEELNGTSLVSTIFISLGINTFMHGRAFLLEWRQMSIDMEKLKTEQVSTQYQSLKNQVNPHFLFNSLNALTSLVYDDQAKAVEFIRKLSQVYRYVLDKKDEELVPIQDEIDFMSNFIFLQKIRFGENLSIEITSENSVGYLPPLALQILVENAIKHNVVSEKYPLTISVRITSEYCYIVNSIKEKLEKDSTGVGLSNLTARYKYLSKKEILIENNGDQFTVKLPILQLEK